MNGLTPKSITAGTRSQKRIVYNGSLNIMPDVKTSMNDHMKNSGYSREDFKQLFTEVNNATMSRPTEDAEIGDSVAVTKLVLSVDVCKNESGGIDSAFMKTICSNASIPNMCLTRDTTTQRIRGGGQADETPTTDLCSSAADVISSTEVIADKNDNENNSVDKKEPDTISSASTSNGDSTQKDLDQNARVVTGPCTKSYPSWFDQECVSDLEKKALPEWFDNSAIHRNETSYIEARQEILKKAAESPDFFLTATVVRKLIAGDVGSLLRLHSFLVTWGFINTNAIGESTPTMYRPEVSSTKDALMDALITADEACWSEEQRSTLSKAVVNQVMKKRKLNAPEDNIDWELVSKEVGQSADACCKEFIEASIPRSNEHSMTLQPSFHDSNCIHELVKGVRPEVIKAAFEGAINASNNVDEAKKAAVISVIASASIEKAKTEDSSIEGLMSEILDLKMKKIEAKLSDLDDVEGMLDAERVALELERRDLYAMRCKFWLGD